jgi:hypothetical protein
VEATRQRIGRAGFLRRSGALVVAASGVGAFAPAAAFADAPPPGDLAYLRLLIAAELLAVDFYGRAFRHFGQPYAPLGQRIHDDASAQYTLLAGLMTAAGQTPATADDIDYSYPGVGLGNRDSVLAFARKLEWAIIGSCVDALQQVQTAAYRQTIAQILTHEAQHQSVLARLQGQPLIGSAFPPPVSMAAMSDFLDTYES